MFDGLVADGVAPGFAAILLGFIAAAVAFFIESFEKFAHRRLWKASFIFLFFLMAGTEMGIISADRREQDRKEAEARKTDKDHFDAIMAGFRFTATSLGIQNQNLTNLSKMRIQSSTTVIQTSAPTGNLKERTLLLSQRIIELLQNDAQSCQIRMQTIKDADEQRKMRLHCAIVTGRTFRFFHGYFDEVVKIKDELAGFHISDPDLDRSVTEEQQNIARSKTIGHGDYDFPLNPVEIQSIAQALANLANKIP